jgi:hypothetical protein
MSGSSSSTSISEHVQRVHRMYKVCYQVDAATQYTAVHTQCCDLLP